jgi:tetratricopeptide (TPR) repeat protein
MCKAALRLDPENQDVLTAVRLIQYGENAYPEEEEEEPEPEAPPVVEEEDTIASAVRQMAAVFEEEQRQAQAKHGSQESPASAVELAFKLAENELNGEILREEDDDDENGRATLSKLERDALIGQALDFEFRGQAEEAIHCYRQAIEGGLNMPAAYFRLGLLYANNGREKEARQYFQQAALDDRYLAAIQEIMQSNF